MSGRRRSVGASVLGLCAGLLPAGISVTARAEGDGGAPTAAECEADRTLLADYRAMHRELSAIPFILEDLALSPDRQLLQSIRSRRDELRDRMNALEEALLERLLDADGAGRLVEFMKPLEEGDLPAFRDVCEELARRGGAAGGGNAETLQDALRRVREARTKFLRRESQSAYVTGIRMELKSRDLYATLPEPRPASAAPAAASRRAAPYLPPTFEPQWTNAVEHWGGTEIRGPGGPVAHRYLMEELVSDRGRAYYEKISGQKVCFPTRPEIIALIRSEVTRQAPPEALAEGGIPLERLQDVAVGLSRCESVIRQFTEKGATLVGRPWGERPVLYEGNDASQSWANVVGCMQISTYWWNRSREEGVTLAWDYRYNVYKGVAEIVSYLRQNHGAKGDDLLKKICDRFSRGDWERMQRFLAEPEKLLR